MTKKEEIINYILNKIETNEWKSGDKILSKYQLSSYFNVSQMTATCAVKELILKGILESKHGSGVFVKSKKKNVIITFHEGILYQDIAKIYRDTLENISKKLIDLGYNIILNPEKTFTKKDYLHSKPTLNKEIDLNEIAAIISIRGNSDLLHNFYKNNIPVITTCEGEYPSVYMTNSELYTIMLKLIDKYLGDNPLFFEYSYSEDYHDYVYNFYSRLKDKFNFANIIISKANITKQIDNYLKNIKDIPTGIVFVDNTIYTNTLPLLKKYDHIFKNTKIITHSNGYEYFPEEYKICRVEYDPNEFCDNIISIFLKLVNKEFSLKNTHIFRGKVINEELLKD